jgi:hypothetical protein
MPDLVPGPDGEWTRSVELGAIAQAYAQAQRFSDAERLLRMAERVAAQVEDWMKPQASNTIF